MFLYVCVCVCVLAYVSVNQGNMETGGIGAAYVSRGSNGFSLDVDHNKLHSNNKRFKRKKHLALPSALLLTGSNFYFFLKVTSSTFLSLLMTG